MRDAGAIITLFVLGAVLLLVSAAGATSWPSVSGTPPDWVGPPASATPAIPAQGTDDLQQPHWDLSRPAQVSPDAREATVAASPTATWAWQRLETIDPSLAHIEVELRGEASAADQAAAREIERLWNGQQRAQAITALRSLEEPGLLLGLGIAWGPSGCPMGARDEMDVRIGATETNAHSFSLDYDEQSGHVFAVIQWGGPGDNATWGIYLSSDGGLTWTETYSWWSSLGILDVSAAVVDDWVYIGYLATMHEPEVRTRRCHVSDGSVDAVYGYQIALDADTHTFRQLALAANADDYDNRIYAAAIRSDGYVCCAWDDADDGTTFTALELPPNANAQTGLSASYSHDYLFGTPFLYISYSGSDASIHVLERTETAWTDVAVTNNVGLYGDTSVSAYGSAVICAYEYAYTGGTGIQYKINYEHGSGSWRIGYPAIPDGIDVMGYFKPRVDARNGMGTALIYQAEPGAFDPIYYRYRMHYGQGLWSDPEAFNDFDTLTGADMTLSPLSHNAGYMDHGAIYPGPNREAYFDWPGPGMADAPGGAEETPRLLLQFDGPHPASTQASLRFALDAPQAVRLQLYDVHGRLIRTLIDGPLTAGPHAVGFDVRSLASGTYLCRLVSGDRAGTQKIIVVE